MRWFRFVADLFRSRVRLVQMVRAYRERLALAWEGLVLARNVQTCQDDIIHSLRDRVRLLESRLAELEHDDADWWKGGE